MKTKKTKRAPDWERIKLDWCTDKFTLRELEDKHGPSAAQICRRAKGNPKTGEAAWQKDLTGAIKKATKAAVQRETVNVAAVTDAAVSVMAETVGVVAAAAELNKQVILGDRKRIEEASELAMDMLHELRLATHSQDELAALFKQATEGMDGDAVIALQQSIKDMLRLHNRVASMHKMIDGLGKLQAMQYKAFRLDEENAKDPAELDHLTDDELDARIKEHDERRRTGA